MSGDRSRDYVLRAVVHLVPDTTSPAFSAEARRQWSLIGLSRGENDVLDFIEKVAAVFTDDPDRA